MAKIFTATASNNGFYMGLAVSADSIDAARASFLSSDLMEAPADEGGDYTIYGEIIERMADEDGDIDLGVIDWAGSADDIFAANGEVVMLDSGYNG